MSHPSYKRVEEGANWIWSLLEILSESDEDSARLLDKEVQQSMCLGDRALCGYNRMAALAAQDIVRAVKARFIVRAAEVREGGVETFPLRTKIFLRHGVAEIAVEADGIVYLPRVARPWWRFYRTKADRAAEDEFFVAALEAAAKEFFLVSRQEVG